MHRVLVAVLILVLVVGCNRRSDDSDVGMDGGTSSSDSSEQLVDTSDGDESSSTQNTGSPDVSDSGGADGTDGGTVGGDGECSSSNKPTVSQCYGVPQRCVAGIWYCGDCEPDYIYSGGQDCVDACGMYGLACDSGEWTCYNPGRRCCKNASDCSSCLAIADCNWTDDRCEEDCVVSVTCYGPDSPTSPVCP